VKTFRDVLISRVYAQREIDTTFNSINWELSKIKMDLEEKINLWFHSKTLMHGDACEVWRWCDTDLNKFSFLIT